MKKTQTIRIHRQREDPFARVPKTVSDSRNLSYEEKGLLCYLCGKPPDWQIYTGDLTKVHSATDYQTRRILNGLRNKGYMALGRERSGKEIVRWVWLVSDSPDYLVWDTLEDLAQEFELAAPERKRLEQLRLTGAADDRSGTNQLPKNREVEIPHLQNQLHQDRDYNKNKGKSKNDFQSDDLPGGSHPPEKKPKTTNTKSDAKAPRVSGGAGLRQPDCQTARKPNGHAEASMPAIQEIRPKVEIEAPNDAMDQTPLINRGLPKRG